MRNTSLFILLLLAFAGISNGQQSPIVGVDWLSENIDDPNLVLIHISQEDDYKEGHLPGARFMSFDSYTVDENGGAYDLPDLLALQELLQNAGLEKRNNIVVYPGKMSHLAVTRLLFTLNYLGFDQVSILSGGKAAWEASDLDLTTEVPVYKKSNLNFTPKQSLLATKEYVASALDNGTTIIDCRAQAYYSGIDVNEHHSGGRKGHIPGAKSIPYTSLFEKTDAGHYQFISERSLKEIFEKQGLKKDEEIILYCHIGLQLTSVYTTSKQLGYTNVKVYDGSFHEWGPDTSLPVTTD